MKRTTSVRAGLIIAVSCALVLAAYGGLEVLVRSTEGSNQGKFIASFACLGFLAGVSLAFDAQPSERRSGRPVLRVALGTLAGLCLGLLWHWPFEGIALSTIIAGGLGYTGSSWAKHL